MVVMAGCRLRGRGFDSRIGTFFHPFSFSISFFPFMLAPPFQCSSIFLVMDKQVVVLYIYNRQIVKELLLLLQVQL